jgi:hypothetical protein
MNASCAPQVVYDAPLGYAWLPFVETPATNGTPWRSARCT